ncbi:hypothetical protein SEMRO_1245_G255660.1 [Seminavis robusta]|uniref:Uncharacterized protein n=1 Tax=Seminavis robusta TaxID=568900 RepID=A0A9N8EMW3_9STRA|nr:hypothetical protein SEMRO_1245_G255660.1 [Seminavis robusta]|eukprot:Sro1245_g255660.1 n/a (177) ;mRNA; f:1555-2085
MTSSVATNTFFFSPQPPAALPEDDVVAIVAAIQQALAGAVNQGTNASLSIQVHPNRFLSNGGLTFLDGLEGTIASQSMQHLELVSDQGGRHVLVHFVGGGTLFAVAHNVEDDVEDDVEDNEAPPAEEEDATDNEGNEDEPDDNSSSGSSTRFEPGNDSDTSSDFDGAFHGLSQLTI